MTTLIAGSRLRHGPASDWTRAVAAPDDGSHLVVRRQDIDFFDFARGWVEIGVTVCNAGPERSLPAAAMLQAATLGAFVDWRPLALLQMPALAPGESAVARAVAERAIARPLGPTDRLPPARLLTALAFPDSERGRAAAPPSGAPTLPSSPFDLLTGPTTHWAGNLNIFVGGKDVERHLARALRIYPGRNNVAMFVVGSSPDYYRFDLRGLEPSWDTALFNPMRAASLARGLDQGMAIEAGTWISLAGSSLLLLALRPPARRTAAGVEVHVTQRSTQKTAVVEFSFDPQAAGPGCYLVD